MARLFRQETAVAERDEQGHFLLAGERAGGLNLAGADDPDDHFRAAGDHVSKETTRLVRPGLVVASDELEPAPQHAAVRIDLLGGEHSAFLAGTAIESPRPAVRTDHPDLDRLRGGDASADEQAGPEQNVQQKVPEHANPRFSDGRNYRLFHWA